MRREPELTVVGLVYFEVFLPPAERPPPGRELFVDRIDVGIGGAANTASVAAALGLAVDLVFPAGEGLTDAAVRAALERAGVRAQPVAGPDDGAITLVYTRPGADRAFVSCARYEALQCDLHLPTVGWIHVPGLAEAEALGPALAEARAGGAKVSVSGGWTPDALTRLGQADMERWDLLILNEDEARFAVGPERDPLEHLTRVARSVVITRGRSGAEAWLGGHAWSVGAEPSGRVEDTTGAGDAFSAGLLAGLARGLGPEAALRLGHRAAARQLAVRGGFADPARYGDLRLS
ncbi:MAG: carbohydrate kinase family protein [Deltaproteobacteria bacterium]|nr:carbohydrate kinase family protein [Deltaproteobacteria bacterium]